MLEGILVDPCGCGGTEPCPAHRFVQRADLVPERLVTGFPGMPAPAVSYDHGPNRTANAAVEVRRALKAAVTENLSVEVYRSLKWSKSLSPTIRGLRALRDEDGGGLGRMGVRARQVRDGLPKVHGAQQVERARKGLLHKER